MLRFWLVLLLAVGAVGWTACGPGHPGPCDYFQSTTNCNGGGGGGGGGGVSAPTVVNVSSGQTTSGVNITVASPASNPTPNVIGIGVSSSLTTWTITDTAATIQQGTTQYVLLAGQGLNANMTVTISGPGDITVSNVQAISSSGTPIIAFSANVSNSAALGARTVILKDTNNDITTFAGSLEVIP